MTCDCCRAPTAPENLDGKPRTTLWLRIIRLFRGQPAMLSYAASRGYDFDVFECERCYGPGYMSL